MESDPEQGFFTPFGLAQSGREYRDFLSQATSKGCPVTLSSEQAGVPPPPQGVKLVFGAELKHLEVTCCCKWEGGWWEGPAELRDHFPTEFAYTPVSPSPAWLK